MRKLFVTPFLVIAFLCSCKKGVKKSDNRLDTTETKNHTSLFPVNFNPFAPKDLDSLASDSLLVKFAWEQFLSLNWQSSYHKNKKRGTPDTNWDWSKNYSDSLVVWETYAHRSELRPYSDKMLPFDTAPHYSFGDSLYPNTTQTSFTLFHNLDENNEIGSCNLYANEDVYNEENMVLYQAKVNRDEYQYILDHYPKKKLLTEARTSGNINLPAGGSVVNGKTIEGAIEIKSAWRLLVNGENPANYFTRKAIYYKKVNNQINYYNKTFALIGLHIIHKTKQRPDFIFATWEHIDVEKDKMAYVLLDSLDRETGKTHKNYARLHPIPALVKRANKSVHQQIKLRNSNSIWQKYRLIGVQGKPTNDQNSMSYFLANYVIESDSILANFHGSSIKTPFDNLPNTTLNNKDYTMGGCMGCHGVAQKKGADFSFLLDDVNKPIKTPDVLDSIPNKAGKLKRYIKYYAKQKV